MRSCGQSRPLVVLRVISHSGNNHEPSTSAACSLPGKCLITQDVRVLSLPFLHLQTWLFLFLFLFPLSPTTTSCSTYAAKFRCVCACAAQHCSHRCLLHVPGFWDTHFPMYHSTKYLSPVPSLSRNLAVVMSVSPPLGYEVRALCASQCSLLSPESGLRRGGVRNTKDEKRSPRPR